MWRPWHVEEGAPLQDSTSKLKQPPMFYGIPTEMLAGTSTSLVNSQGTPVSNYPTSAGVNTVLVPYNYLYPIYYHPNVLNAFPSTSTYPTTTAPTVSTPNPISRKKQYAIKECSVSLKNLTHQDIIRLRNELKAVPTLPFYKVSSHADVHGGTPITSISRLENPPLKMIIKKTTTNNGSKGAEGHPKSAAAVWMKGSSTRMEVFNPCFKMFRSIQGGYCQTPSRWESYNHPPRYMAYLGRSAETYGSLLPKRRRGRPRKIDNKSAKPPTLEQNTVVKPPLVISADDDSLFGAVIKNAHEAQATIGKMETCSRLSTPSTLSAPETDLYIGPELVIDSDDEFDRHCVKKSPTYKEDKAEKIGTEGVGVRSGNECVGAPVGKECEVAAAGIECVENVLENTCMDIGNLSEEIGIADQVQTADGNEFEECQLTASEEMEISSTETLPSSGDETESFPGGSGWDQVLRGQDISGILSKLGDEDYYPDVSDIQKLITEDRTQPIIDNHNREQSNAVVASHDEKSLKKYLLEAPLSPGVNLLAASANGVTTESYLDMDRPTVSATGVEPSSDVESPVVSANGVELSSNAEPHVVSANGVFFEPEPSLDSGFPVVSANGVTSKPSSDVETLVASANVKSSPVTTDIIYNPKIDIDPLCDIDHDVLVIHSEDENLITPMNNQALSIIEYHDEKFPEIEPLAASSNIEYSEETPDLIFIREIKLDPLANIDQDILIIHAEDEELPLPPSPPFN